MCRTHAAQADTSRIFPPPWRQSPPSSLPGAYYLYPPRSPIVFTETSHRTAGVSVGTVAQPVVVLPEGDLPALAARCLPEHQAPRLIYSGVVEPASMTDKACP